MVLPVMTRVLLLGLCLSVGLLAQSPESTLGTLPVPPTVEMSGAVFHVVIAKIDLEANNTDRSIQYFILYFDGGEGGLTLIGDVDVPLMQWISKKRSQTPMVLYLATGAP